MTMGASAGITPTLDANDLIKTVPGLAEVASLEARSPLKLPSSSLSLSHVVAAATDIRSAFADGVDGVVVIQGTDTIEETAFALDLLVDDERPVVVTGAMRGPQAPGAEGPANLLAAAIVAASREARGLGTLVVLNDEIHAARLVRKAHTALPSAFASDNGGRLGLIAEGLVRLFTRATPFALPALRSMEGEFPPVALIKVAMGDDGRLLRATPQLGFQGLVIEGMGAGHVPASIADLIGELAAMLPVVLTSRTLAGPVFTRTYGYAGSEIDLIRRGVLTSGHLTAVKARLLLMVALKAGWSREAIAGAFKIFD